jgi:hypothetical protein
VTDDELTDAWEACTLARSISHDEHVRIGRVLVLRHGNEAEGRLVDGTRRNCEALGVADRFDEGLTRRWAARIGAAVEAEAGASYADFIGAHAELARSDLLGLPAWKTES